MKKKKVDRPLKRPVKKVISRQSKTITTFLKDSKPELPIEPQPELKPETPRHPANIITNA